MRPLLWLGRLIIMSGFALPDVAVAAHPAEQPRLTVMTMNMFTGTNFEELVAAQDIPALLAAVAVTVQKIEDSDPAERATAMAG